MSDDKPKKFADMDSTEFRRIGNELEAHASNLGQESYDKDWGSTEKPDTRLEETLGICASCSQLLCAESQYGNVFARCGQFDAALTGKNRIVNCTAYQKRGKLSLNEMYQMAWIIEPVKKKIGLV